MKIAPLAPGQGVQQPQGGRTESQARAAAIAKFSNPTPGVAPANQNPTGIANPSRIAPEEMLAIPQMSDTGAPSEDTETQVGETPHDPQMAVEQEPKTDPLSSQYALLARKEKAMRAKAQQQEQAMKAREDALAAKERELSSKQPQDLSSYIPKDMLKTNTLKALAEAGVSYDEITQQMLNTNPTDPRTEVLISKLEAKIAALEKANETSQENMTKQQQSAYDAAIKQIRQDATTLVRNDPAYEMIKATNSVSDVVELIEETYKRDQTVMSVEDAAAEVEEYLAAEAEKLARVQKIQNRLKPVAKATTNSNAQPPQFQKQPQPMKTLTNASASSRQLSARERALLAFKGELKS